MPLNKSDWRKGQAAALVNGAISTDWFPMALRLQETRWIRQACEHLGEFPRPKQIPDLISTGKNGHRCFVGNLGLKRNRLKVWSLGKTEPLSGCKHKQLQKHQSCSLNVGVLFLLARPSYCKQRVEPGAAIVIVCPRENGHCPPVKCTEPSFDLLAMIPDRQKVLPGPSKLLQTCSFGCISKHVTAP